MNERPDDVERVTLWRAEVVALTRLAAAIDPDNAPSVDAMRNRTEDEAPREAILVGSAGGPVRVGVQVGDKWDIAVVKVPASVWQFLRLREAEALNGGAA